MRPIRARRIAQVKLILAAGIIAAVVAGWVIPFLPGRAPWVVYSLPAATTRLHDDTMVVTVPARAVDGTDWNVELRPGASPGEDAYVLLVRRWQSTARVPPGEIVPIYGRPHLYLFTRANGDSNQYQVYLRRRE